MLGMTPTEFGKILLNPIKASHAILHNDTEVPEACCKDEC